MEVWHGSSSAWRFGIVITCVVLWRWVRLDSMRDTILLGIGWSVIAAVCDYLFLVKLLNPPDGYYKLDVYLYYLLTLLLPLFIRSLKASR